MLRYFIWLIAVLGLIIILIVLLLPGSKKGPAGNLLTYRYANTDAVTRLKIDGPINADAIHKSIEINVDRSSVTYDEFSGYNGHIVKQQTYPSNENAYNNFLWALYRAGFSLPVTSTASELGYCPLGQRYIFSITNGSSTVQRMWSTSCGIGIYKGSVSLTLQLFENQVPDYSSLTSGTNL